MDVQTNINKLAQLQKQKPSEAKARLISLFDAGSFKELDPFFVSESVVSGFGTVAGKSVCAFSQNIQSESGAVDERALSKIKKVYDLALKTGVPIIGVYDSNGAKLKDGFAALSCYSQWMSYVNKLSGVVPQISIVLGSCIATAALIACSADIVVMDKHAQLNFTVSNQDFEDNQELSALKSGVVHILTPNKEQAVERARQLLALLPENNLSAVEPIEFFDSSATVTENLKGFDLIESICDKNSLVRLQENYARCISIGFGTIAGKTVGFVSTASEKICGDGASKTARFVRLCDCFNLPVITFLGAKGIADKTGGKSSLCAAAQLAHAYADATTVKISVITAQTCASAYLLMAGKETASDLSFAWPNSSVSPLAVDTMVELLWHDRLAQANNLPKKRLELEQEYRKEQVSAFESAKSGTVDSVIMAEDTRKTLLSALEILAGKRVKRLPKKHGNMPL